MFRKILTLISLVLSASVPCFAKSPNADTLKRYIKVPEGYLMVLRQNDSILTELEKLTLAENIPSANFSGMGFVNVQLGFYDFTRKRYNPKDFKNVGLASMQGTIAWQKGKDPCIWRGGQ